MAFFQNKEIKFLPTPVPDTPGIFPPDPPTPPTPDPGQDPNIPRPTFSGNTSLYLYKIYDEPEKVDKTLGAPVSYDLVIKEAISVITPFVFLNSDTDIRAYNYAYIAATGRYYFVTIELVQGNLYKLVMKVDVAYTFRAAIRAMNAIMVKTNDPAYANMDYADGSFVNQEGKRILIKHYDQGFLSTPKNILIVAGL